MGSVTDGPIKSIGEDLLKMENYSHALSNFIIDSDTPITIGLQGEWGTGKTSLMSILQEDLQKKDIATSWVNTWEYSMFRGSNETTPKVLQGMLDRLEVSCKEKGLWDIGDEVNQSVKKVGRFLGSIANQIVKTQTGLDIAGASASDADNESMSADIAVIKSEIASIINKLIESPGNPFKKVVFFIDDLDRIPPLDAVEVLEALKNIFDIPKCIFILAIDYDVVVKGLEGKFGPKTELNEREFRSFFDKIIQVPFSMPVGTYSIEGFLTSKLEQIGIKIDDSYSEQYAKIVRYTVGSNPRSLKRYLNSFSLINNVRAIQSSDEPADDFMLFALLGIQISYPQIFRLITQDSDYLNWNKGFSNKYQIDWDDVQNKLSLFADNDLVDEEWEQVVWGYCQKEVYLRARVFDVLNLLNFLRDQFGDKLHDELEKAMEFAAITSVDDDVESRQAQAGFGKKVKFDSLDAKVNQLTELGGNKDGILALATLLAPFYDKVKEDSRYRLSLAKTGGSFNDDSIQNLSDRQQIYFRNPKKRLSGISFSVKQSTGLVDELYEHINEITGEANPDYTSIFDPTPEDRYQIRELKIMPALANKLSKEDYIQLIQHIAERVIEACDARGH